MKITTLVNAVSTQNASGYVTNASQTAFSATTTAYSIAAYYLSGAGLASQNVQKPIRIWFQHSPFNATAATIAPQFNSPMCFEVTPKQVGNAAYAQSVAVPAMGTYLYLWIEMPSITDAGGTITVDLVELN
jgi:hypothetical protein